MGDLRESNDLTTISDLSLEKVNAVLLKRYEKDVIYTFSGSILISVNPYKELFHVYDQYYMDKYHNAASGTVLSSLPPHIYQIAESAYVSLKRTALGGITNGDFKTNQSIVISGESGAGKTENTKLILNYLCHVTNFSDINNDNWVQHQILEANTILEAFGNAKTVRNDNSSRFGKFMQVCFDSKWMIRGCIIQDYLLEQSRITFQTKDERNYHVFYQLTKAAEMNPELSKLYQVHSAKSYKYLNQSGCINLTGIDDSKRFDQLRLAFTVLQIPFTDQIFKVISAILWLGNLEFEDVIDDVEERCVLSKVDTDTTTKIIASLLGLQLVDLQHILLTRQINVRGNITEIPLKNNEANGNRHAMSKALYSRTFAWLINHINTCTNPGQDTSKFLGLLDIFGFENFECNSFEQFCINYTNEKLQKFFNHYVFALEQEIYKAEGIKYSHIEFTDNSICLELIEKPPRCLLKLLTEQCHLPKGSDPAYLTNITTEFRTNPCFTQADDRRNLEKEFTIIHYAGSVRYQIDGFVEKNKDVQQDLFFHFLSDSDNEFVRELVNFQDLLGCTLARGNANGDKAGANTMGRNANTSKCKPTVSEAFRIQLGALVDVLQSTNPWYVRTIKPNSNKAPNNFEASLVMEQLKYLGMLEIIRIRKEGFPVHFTFEDFVKRYKILGKYRTYPPKKEISKDILQGFKFPITEWQLGFTKVFLRGKVYEPLEEKRLEVLNSKATKIQAIWRGHRVRKHYSARLRATLTIQKFYQTWKLRLNFLRKRKAAIVIQSRLRGMFAREVAAALREMRRVEEAMRKQEEYMNKRKSIIQQQSENGSTDGSIDSSQEAKEELDKLARELSEMQSGEPGKLENLYSFLTEAKDNDEAAAAEIRQIISNTVKPNQPLSLATLGSQMDLLVANLEDELESQTTTTNNRESNNLSSLDSEFEDDVTEENDHAHSNGLTNGVAKKEEKAIPPSPPALPPPGEHLICPPPPPLPSNGPAALISNKFGKCQPSLPPPTVPPPPIPPANTMTMITKPPLTAALAKQQQMQLNRQNQMNSQNGNQNQVVRRKVAGKNGDEPIYESIKPRIENGSMQGQGQGNINASSNISGPRSGEPMASNNKNRDSVESSQSTKSWKFLGTPAHQGHAVVNLAQTNVPQGPTGPVVTPNPPPQPPPAPPSVMPMTNVNGVQQQPQRQPMPQKPVIPQIPKFQNRAQTANGNQQSAIPHRNLVTRKLQEFTQTMANNVNKPVQNQNVPEQKRDENKTNEDEEDLSLLEFALNYFNDWEKKSANSGKDGIVPKEEMISYTKSGTIPSSHLHLYDPSNIQLSITCFKDLQKYAKGEFKPETEIQFIQNLISYGLEREELRDEIYVQVVRLINKNDSSEQIEKLYLLLCLLVVSFQPTKVFSKYILAFLNTNYEDSKISDQVQWVRENLKRNANVLNFCRKFPPSSVEITAMARLGTIVCRFFFLDSSRTKAIDIHPMDTAWDAMVKLGEKIGLNNVDSTWAIFESGKCHEEHVPMHHYIYDVIAKWEQNTLQLQAQAQGTLSTVGTLRKQKTAPNGNSLGSCGDNKFIFKKRLFKQSSREIPQDPVEVNLLYAQAVHSVVKEDAFPISEKVALQLAGLQLQVLLGDSKGPVPNTENYTAVENFLPGRITRTRPHGQWVQILNQVHKQYGSGKSELVSKVWYLSLVMNYPLFGNTMFEVVYRGYWLYGNTLLLGISSDGISMIKTEDKFILYEYSYNQIESIQLDTSENLITINLNRALPPDTHKCFVFEAKAASEIANLISSYYPSLSCINSDKTQTIRKLKQITNEHRFGLYQNLINCRKLLVENGALRKPKDNYNLQIKLKSTLRRLSKSKLNEQWQRQYMRRFEQFEYEADYPVDFFSYSKHPITASLTVLENEEDNLAAISVFQMLLQYAGVLGQPISTDEDQASHVQSLLQVCWRKEPLINELFCQIVKQTTDHPNPNSNINQRNWAVLSLLCSLLAPNNPTIRRYLVAHLKRCGTDSVTEEGKFARFAEKCLVSTINALSAGGTVATQHRRQWSPSKQEILCTLNRRPLTARFFLMDGKYHVLNFTPNDNANDLLQILKAKIGLGENVKGYSLYELGSVNNWERSLLPNERPVEVMSRWEKQRSTNPNLQFKFVMKKHLFTELEIVDPVEKELIYHQLLHQARNDRFPVSETEAAMLVALQAQVELGDYRSTSSNSAVGEFPDYCHVSSHCLPTRIAASVSHESVARHHQSLTSTPGPQAKQAVLNLLRSWPLHRASIFDVTQSFTSNWPRTLWLAVDQQGLHLLQQRTRHTLSSFSFENIISYSPSPTCFMLITNDAQQQQSGNPKPSKIILNTNQGYQISQLMKEYIQLVLSQSQKLQEERLQQLMQQRQQQKQGM